MHRTAHHLGKYEASTPAPKELHGSTNPVVSGLICFDLEESISGLGTMIQFLISMYQSP